MALKLLKMHEALKVKITVGSSCVQVTFPTGESAPSVIVSVLEVSKLAS